MATMQEKAWEAVVAALAERVKNNPRGELSIIATELGATRGTVSRWLSGELKGRRIPYDKMIRIMRALSIDPALYFGAQASMASGPVHSLEHGDALNPSRGTPLQNSRFLPGYSGNEDAGLYGSDANGQGILSSPTALGDKTPLFAPQYLDDPAYYQVPWLEARASMGGGSLEVSKEVRSYLSFRRDWLLSKGPIGNMVVVSVQGDSMSPTIPDGSVVLINEAVAAPPVNGKIYLVCYRDELFIKRLKVKGGQAVSLLSDFDGSEVAIKKSEYFNIIGRAIWYGKDL